MIQRSTNVTQKYFSRLYSERHTSPLNNLRFLESYNSNKDNLVLFHYTRVKVGFGYLGIVPPFTDACEAEVSMNPSTWLKRSSREAPRLVCEEVD